MADPQYLPEARPRTPITDPPPMAPVRSLRSSRCQLCGVPLTAACAQHRVLSPYGNAKLRVCSTCCRAALGEGYRALG